MLFLVQIRNTLDNNHSKLYSKFIEEDAVKMLEFLIKSFVQCGWRVFQHTVCIPLDTNYAPLLADPFLYEAYFIFHLIQSNTKKIVYSEPLISVAALYMTYCH